MYHQWQPYVPVARRRLMAAQEMQRLAKKGHRAAPVKIVGRQIARTFWGKAWCDHLESYGDFANRLPRGRTYVRNGSVVDLAIESGKVAARVSGSRLYDVKIEVKPLDPKRWKELSARCAGEIDSLVELLQGRFADGVMERLCDRETGLFPAPAEIAFRCSCPDWASMCKHVAASLYGVGARLDETPELFFTLRQVDAKDLIAEAGGAAALPKKGAASGKVLETDDLSALFGIEIGEGGAAPAPAPKAKKPRKAKETPPPAARKSARPPASEEPPVAPPRKARAKPKR
jgi:uncharacterized Zn finger protein